MDQVAKGLRDEEELKGQHAAGEAERAEEKARLEAERKRVVNRDERQEAMTAEREAAARQRHPLGEQRRILVLLSKAVEAGERIGERIRNGYSDLSLAEGTSSWDAGANRVHTTIGTLRRDLQEIDGVLAETEAALQKQPQESELPAEAKSRRR